MSSPSDISQLPTDNELLSQVRRTINSLKQKEPTLRKNAIVELQKIVTEKKVSPSIYEQIMHMGLKQLIKCYYDHLEFVRENSIKITIQLLSRCNNIRPFLPYIFEVLKDRTNCFDLQGIDKLPEKMRPQPGQKPKIMIKINEGCQEIRILYCALIKRIVLLLEQDKHQMSRHLDDMVNILRTLIMDPSPDIQKQACEVLIIFCNDYKDILLHFTETMGRAVLLPLISKKSKIRIVGLTALTSILWCGLWKYNAFIFENLIGFRDPNSVPIKDFYEPSNNINYLATFITDPNDKVRQHFMKNLKIWICDLNDKYDHHGKLVPYLLSGLFDTDITVQQTAIEAINLIGKQVQEQKQKQFRENKQFAIDAAWTWDGKLISLPIDGPIKTRPSLGSRYFIRGHVRKFWPALYKQLKDINEQHRLRSANLALYGVIYTENYLTQFLDNFIPQLLPCILCYGITDEKVASVICKIFYYVGRYCEQSSYLHLIKSALEGKLIQNQQFIRCAMKGLAMLVKGNLDAVPEGESLKHKKDNIIELLNMLQECEIAGDVYNFNCIQARQISQSILKGILERASPEQKEQIFSIHYLTLIKLAAVSYFQQLYSVGYSLKSSDKVQIGHQNQFNGFLKITDQLHRSYEKGYQDIQQLLSNIFCNPPSLMDSDWKFLIIFYRYLCLKGVQKQQLKNLFLLVQDAICQCLSQNKSIELLAFGIKFIYNLIATVPKSGDPSILNMSDKFLRDCMKNLENFKPIKKVPIYDQNPNKVEEEANLLKTSEENYFALFSYCCKSMSGYIANKIALSQSQLAHLFEYYLRCFKRVEKNKQCQVEALRSIWAVFKKIQTDQTFSFKFKFTEGAESKFMLPHIIQFCIERLEAYLQPILNKMVFDILESVVKAWPKVTKIAQKLESIYPQFPELLEKLFKYSLNEKDQEIKQKYTALLQSMAKKMPEWFKYQCNRAKQQKRYQKIRLIEQIIHNANI